MEKKDKKILLSYVLDIMTDTIVKVIKKINKFLTNKKHSVVVKIIIRILILLLLLSILEIPFFIIEKIGLGLIYLLSTTLRDIIGPIWKSTVSYSYFLISLIIVFRVIYDMSKKKQYKIEVESITKDSNELYKTVCNILKVIIGIVLIPLVLVLLLLFTLLGMIIYMLTHGMVIIGPVLVVAGLIILIFASLSYIYDIVFFYEGGKK